jgi:hypothetical protein
LTAIGDLEGGSEALADYFTEKWSRVEAFARSGTFDTVEDDGEILSEQALYQSAYVRPRVDLDEVADQDWMQMAWLLRHELPDLFIEMLIVLRAKARAFDLGLDEEEVTEEEDDGKVETGDTDRGKATPAADPDDEFADTPKPRAFAEASREIKATVAWMDDEPLVAGRVYLALHGHRWIKAKVKRIVHSLDINTLQEHDATEIAPNAIGHIELALQEAITAVPYAQSRVLGSLILVDTATHKTSGALLLS